MLSTLNTTNGEKERKRQRITRAACDVFVVKRSNKKLEKGWQAYSSERAGEERMPFHAKVNKNLLYGRRGFVQREEEERW